MNQPTRCDDVRLSQVHFGELSEEACKEENAEYHKYNKIGDGYCHPHLSEHPNLLDAIEECKKHSDCTMFFENWRVL